MQYSTIVVYTRDTDDVLLLLSNVPFLKEQYVDVSDVCNHKGITIQSTPVFSHFVCVRCFITFQSKAKLWGRRMNKPNFDNSSQ